MKENINMLRSMRVRDLVSQVITVGLLISTVLVVWRVLCIVPATEHPVVVVISGSMEPGYRRGDILLLHHLEDRYPVRVGDIIVYTLPKRDVPIVHRVLRMHVREADGKRLYLTKGDNNRDNDRVLFTPGMEWIEEDMILGKSYAYIPYLGYVTVMFQESTVVKYVTLALLGFFLLTSEAA